MALIGVFRDECGHTATIAKQKRYPYRGAFVRTDCYKLTITADYDMDYTIFVSVYDSKDAALCALMDWYNKSWRKVE